MSLTTLLLAFLPAIVRPKPEPEKSAREKELEGEIDRLLLLNESAAGRILVLEAERDSWRRRCEEARDMLERDRIDRRLEEAMRQANQAMNQAQNCFGMQPGPFADAVTPATPQQQLAQYQQAAQYGLAQSQGLAQYQAQQAQQAQNCFGMRPGPFADARALERICNCVPARHDAFLGGFGA